MADETKKSVPDTATTYERAKPEKQSLQGKLTADKPTGKKRPDDHSKQNESPDRKH